MKRSHQIGVRELVEFVFLSGDLVLDKFSSRKQSREGQKAHLRIQKNRPDNYTPEVPVNGTFQNDGLELKIVGRLDGLFSFPGRYIIDEIKTIRSDPEDVIKMENIRHWAQAKIYGHLFSVEHHLKQVDIQLTYVNLKNRDMKETRKTFSAEELETYCQDVINVFFDWLLRIENWRTNRDLSIEKLQFPFSNYRKGQKEMAVQVYKTISSGKQLLMQAPTGIGKTVGVLYAAVKTFPRLENPLIFYLTARTTGKEAAEKAIRLMQKKGLSFKYLELTAKEKLCFYDELRCNPEECPYAKGYYDRLKNGIVEIFNYDDFSRRRIKDLALKHNLCPFEFSLALSIWVDCIICDYNYVFDPKIRLRRFFSDDRTSSRELLIMVDEAHNLIDRSRDMFSAGLQKKRFLTIRRPFKTRLPTIYKQMGKLNRECLKIWHLLNSEDIAEKVLPDNLINELKVFLKLTENWLVKNIKISFRQDLLDLYFDVSSFLRISELYEDNFLTYYQKKGRNLFLKLLCLDPAPNLKQVLEFCYSIIFFSATITPLKYFKELFGCNHSAAVKVYSSPFPRENLLILLNDNISTYYRDRKDTIVELGDIVVTFVLQKKGNYLIYLPSYKYLDLLVNTINDKLKKMDVIIQQPGSSEQERKDFLARFSHEHKRSLVGFAVMGGVYGEGIDLVGERLEGAVIVGVGLPGLSFERDLIRDYFNRSNNGFDYAYKYPGMIRVLQAAGRVIRSELDKGVVLMIDKRFGQPSYERLLIKEWNRKKILSKEMLSKRLNEFWNNHKDLSLR